MEVNIQYLNTYNYIKIIKIVLVLEQVKSKQIKLLELLQLQEYIIQTLHKKLNSNGRQCTPP